MKRSRNILTVALLFIAATLLAALPARSADKPANYPQRGRNLTIIVPYNAGGSSDTDARFLAAAMEKKMETAIEIVNKPGAGSQVGMTQLTASRPDGHTLCWGSFAGIVIPYLDPDRQTSYGRKDYKAVSFIVGQPLVLLVGKNSPFKSLKDVVSFAKINPEKFKIALSGILLPPHLSVLELEKQAGIKTAMVHFDGEATALTSFIGGHTEGLVCTVSSALNIVKNNQARALGVMDTAVNPYLPEVKTMAEQGYNISMGTEEALLVPSATAPAIIRYLEETIREIMKEASFQDKAKQMNIPIRYRAAADSETHIDAIEQQVKPLIEAVRKSQK
jgi:tripartite-type tricarboxylate transporter receptor subunit TctC